jgi:hypothetical protein
MLPLRPLTLFAAVALAAPADRLPTPRPEPCVPINTDPAEGEISAANGLGYEEVVGALNGVIQTALRCERPAETDALNLTYELMVGCDGVVATIEAIETDGAPQPYIDCVTAVIAKADFPAHDMPDGMPVTYPVNVAW